MMKVSQDSTFPTSSILTGNKLCCYVFWTCSCCRLWYSLHLTDPECCSIIMSMTDATNLNKNKIRPLRGEIGANVHYRKMFNRYGHTSSLIYITIYYVKRFEYVFLKFLPFTFPVVGHLWPWNSSWESKLSPLGQLAALMSHNFPPPESGSRSRQGQGQISCTFMRLLWKKMSPNRLKLYLWGLAPPPGKSWICYCSGSPLSTFKWVLVIIISKWQIDRYWLPGDNNDFSCDEFSKSS